jgi:hypothetical protein
MVKIAPEYDLFLPSSDDPKRRLPMDIPALSMALNQGNLSQTVGIRVLQMIKDQSVQTNLGSNIDINV